MTIETMPGVPLSQRADLFAHRRGDEDFTYVRSTLLIDGQQSIVEHYVSPNCGPYTEAVEVFDESTRHSVHDRLGRMVACTDRPRAKRRRLIEAGEHRFVITSAEWWLTKRQRDTVKLALTIVGGPSDGLVLWHHLMISKTNGRCMNPWTRGRCEQLGVSRVALGAVSLDDLPAVFLGREGTVTVRHRDICGNVYADVERFGA